MSKYRIALFFLWAVFIVHTLATVVVSVINQTGGIELARLQQQKVDQEAENGEVLQQYLEASSLTTINRKAREELGMVDAPIIRLYDN